MILFWIAIKWKTLCLFAKERSEKILWQCEKTAAINYSSIIFWREIRTLFALCGILFKHTCALCHDVHHWTCHRIHSHTYTKLRTHQKKTEREHKILCTMHSNKSVNMCVNAAKSPIVHLANCSTIQLLLQVSSTCSLFTFRLSGCYSVGVSACIGWSRHKCQHPPTHTHTHIHIKTNSTPDHFYRQSTIFPTIYIYMYTIYLWCRYVHSARMCLYVAFSFWILVQNIFQHLHWSEEVLLEIIA